MIKDCPGFIVYIRAMEIVHKRNKATDPCNNDGEIESIKVLEELTVRLGCTPQHWDFPSTTSACTLEELKKYRDVLDNRLYSAHQKKLNMPCRLLEWSLENCKIITEISWKCKRLECLLAYGDIC